MQEILQARIRALGNVAGGRPSSLVLLQIARQQEQPSVHGERQRIPIAPEIVALDQAVEQSRIRPIGRVDGAPNGALLIEAIAVDEVGAWVRRLGPDDVLAGHIPVDVVVSG
jgi:hypothetical protein